MGAFQIGAGGISADNSVNTAFRKASANDEDFEDLFDRRESVDDGNLRRSQSIIKLSQVIEGSLYIELCKECDKCKKPLREEELFS